MGPEGLKIFCEQHRITCSVNRRRNRDDVIGERVRVVIDADLRVFLGGGVERDGIDSGGVAHAPLAAIGSQERAVFFALEGFHRIRKPHAAYSRNTGELPGKPLGYSVPGCHLVSPDRLKPVRGAKLVGLQPDRKPGLVEVVYPVRKLGIAHLVLLGLRNERAHPKDYLGQGPVSRHLRIPHIHALKPGVPADLL